MANVLMVPASGAIIFDSQAAQSNIISPLSAAPRLSYDNAGGLNITSYTTAASALDRFSVDGSNGRLFSVSDALTGIIFSVNDASGLPVIEVESNLTDKITIGAYGSNALVVNDTKVGIGTATPNEKLTVVGVISSTNIVYASGGNSNLWNSAYATVNSISANGATTYTTVNANSANWSSVYSTVCATSANYILDGGNTKGANILIGTNDNFNLNLETGGTTKMTVTSSGDVGIGNTTPAYKFDVTGSARINGINSVGLTLNKQGSAFDNQILFTELGVTKGSIQNDSSGNFIIGGTNSAITQLGAGNSGTLALVAGGSGTITVSIGGSESMRFLSNGNVGIGTVSPSNKLDVIGNAFIGDSTTAGSTLTVSTGAGSVNKNGVSIINSPAVSYTALSLQSNWSDGNGGDLVKIFNATGNKFIINNTGNVGIGTTTTSAKLDVRNAYGLPSSTNGTIRILSTDAAGTAGVGATLSLGGNAANAARNAVTLLGANESTSGDRGYLGVFTNGTGISNAYGERLRVDSNGSIIINPVNNNLAAVKGLIIRASSGQTANLTEWQNSSNVGIGAVSSDGSLGIGTTTPSEKLTVVGVISSTNIVYASGGNSNLWNSAYATVNSISANGANTYTTVNANSASWSSAYTAVAPNSASWNSVYSAYNTNSANIVDLIQNSSTQGRIEYSTLPTGILTVDLSNLGQGGSPQFTNLTLTGNLSVLGDFTYLNTSVSVTSALSVVNAGTGPALYIKQSGNTPIAYFLDADGTGDIIFENNGFVGLGTASPNNRLTVVGVISSTNIIYASGGNSDLWNSTYTSVNANSANGATTYTTVNTNSASWNSTYTTVNTNSANYILAGGNSKGADITIGTNDNYVLNLETAGTTKVTVTSAGLVGIGVTDPVTKLQINNKVIDNAGFVYDTNSLLVTHQTPTATATLNDPKTALVLARQGTSGQAFGAAAAFNLSRFENSGTNSRTRLDISLANSSFDLNNNNVLTLLSNGNVGIGTVVPSQRLHVVGSVTIGTGVLDLDSGYSIRWGGAASGIYSGSGTSDMVVTVGSAERLRINGSSGNVGIGVTSPGAKLTVSGTISSNNVIYAVGGNSNIWNSTYTSVNANSANGATTYTTVNANSANWSNAYTNVNANSSNWNTTYNTVNTNSSNWTFAYNQVNSGYLNWNSTYTTVNANSANWSSLYSTVCAASANYILDGGNLKGSNITIGTKDNFNLNLETADTTRVTVTSAGNVGIGNTNPLAKLTVDGNILLGTGNMTAQGINLNSTDGRNTIGFGSPGSWFMGINAQSSNQSINITDANSVWPGTPRVTFLRDGNVGIGTTTPGEKLTVAGNISANGTLAVTATNQSDGIGVVGNNTTAGIGMRINNTGAGGSDWWLFSSGSAPTAGLGSFALWNNNTSKYALWATSAGVVTFSNGIRIPTQFSHFGVGTYGTVSETNGGLAYITGNNIKASTTVNNQVEKVTSGANPAQFIRMRYDQGISLHTGVGAGDAAGTNYADDINSRLIVNLTGNVGIGTTTPSEKLTVAGNISSSNVIYASGGNSNLWNQNTSALYQATSGQFAVRNANNFFSASQSLTGDLTVKGIISVDKGDGTPLQEVSTKNFSIAMAIALS